MAAHKDLIGGGEGADLGRSVLDLGHAIDAGCKHDDDGTSHGLHHDGASSPLEPVQGHDRKLPERRLEEQHQNQRHLSRQYREQELNHPGTLGKDGRDGKEKRRRGIS